MEPDRWVEICSVYSQALDLPATKRAVFIRNRCAQDQALLAEVESLLSMAARPGFLDAPTVASDEFRPSAVIADRFRIISLLGRGGMGKVYEAEDMYLGERVALKTLHPEIASDPSFVARFKQEIQVAKRVTHRNVCRIHDVVLHSSPASPNGRMFLTMELLPGETLARRLAAGPMMPTDAFPLIEQLAKGLEAAHQMGIIHRDFKTNNIMLTPEQGVTRAVITDFGLARAFDSSGYRSGDSITRSGELVGTLDYMAPEQLTGGAVTPATDIYAFGIVIYEMVTGIRPFHDDLPIRAAMRRLHETPQSPRRLVPDLDPCWERTILCCLNPKPEERFQKTSDLMMALGKGVVPKAHHSWRSPFLAMGSAFTLLVVGAAALLIRSSFSKHFPERVEWQQITNFGDAATDPTFSPDGRVLAFKRGGNWFMNPGQIYLKVLPDGQPVQLTSDSSSKMAPAFSPDGSRISYTMSTRDSNTWQIAEASVLPGGGEPRIMLTNAEGLTWIDKEHILFSEQREPAPLMAVVMSTESRTGGHDVYVPPNSNWMAHFSAISPDHKQVLIVEMQPGPGNNASEFFPCRLVPFDGSSKGKQVGPVPGHCIAAAWSPNGKWMYFSARVGGNFHLWRQRADGGEAEQITSGPTQERGLAIAPDGRSVIASVGVDQTTVWIHDPNGEHQISGEGNARSPRFAPDGKKVYYLWSPDLWVIELASGHAEKLLPGVDVAYYAISPDGKAIAYSNKDGSLWCGAIDHSTPPVKLASQGIAPEFSALGNIVFRARQNSTLYSVHPDGMGMHALTGNFGNATIPIFSLSPDEEWAIREIDDKWVGVYSRDGRRSSHICNLCTAGWTPDGKFFWITLSPLLGQNGMTGLIPLKDKATLPPIPREGIRTQTDLTKIPDIRIISYQGHQQGISPSPDGASYAFVKQESRWNLYRIPLP